MTTLWNPRKPLTQPPHFRKGMSPAKPQDAVVRDALLALRHARNERSNPMSRKAA